MSSHWLYVLVKDVSHIFIFMLFFGLFWDILKAFRDIGNALIVIAAHYQKEDELADLIKSHNPQTPKQ